MNEEEMREAFEEQFKARWPTMSIKRTGKSGAYDDPGINVEWLAFKVGWQARGAAEREAGRREGIEQAAQAIRALVQPAPKERTLSEISAFGGHGVPANLPVPVGCDRYTVLCKPGAAVGIRFQCLREKGHKGEHYLKLAEKFHVPAEELRLPAPVSQERERRLREALKDLIDMHDNRRLVFVKEANARVDKARAALAASQESAPEPQNEAVLRARGHHDLPRRYEMKTESTDMQERAQQLWRELDGLDWSSHEQAIVGILRDALEQVSEDRQELQNNSLSISTHRC